MRILGVRIVRYFYVHKMEKDMIMKILKKNKCLAIFIDVKITYCILCSYILSKCISTGLFHKMHFLVTLFHQLITKKAFAVGALLAPGSTVIVENTKLSTYKNIPSCTWHKVH